MPPARRRGQPLSWGLALLVLAYLVGTLGDALHWLTTAHRLCETHGRIEHVVEEGSDEGRPERPRSGPVVRADGRLHESCGLGGFATETTVPFTLCASESLPPFPEADRLPAPRSTVQHGPRFALAPSRSPPEA